MDARNRGVELLRKRENTVGSPTTDIGRYLADVTFSDHNRRLEVTAVKGHLQ
jgi:hypothetical protein